MRFTHILTRALTDTYISQRWWPPDSALDFLARNARRYPHTEAFVDSRSRVTWSQMETFSDRLALKLLELGLRSGEDILAQQLPSSVESYVVAYAALKAGLIGLPLGYTLRQAELEHLLGTTAAVAIVIRPEFGGFSFLDLYEELRPGLPELKHLILADGPARDGLLSLRTILDDPIEERYPRSYLHQYALPLEQPAFALTTSGTTGVPKLTLNLGYATTAEGFAERLRITRQDVALACATIWGGGSGLVCLPAASGPYMGIRIVLQEKWNAEEALRLIEQEKVTVATGVPAQMIQMLSVPNLENYDLSSLRIFYYAGAVLPPEAAKEIEARMGCQVITLYGAIGAGCFTQTGVDDPPEKRSSTVGQPLRGNEIEVRDEQGRLLSAGEIGEVFVRGPAVHGCFVDPALNRELYDDRLFYRTGDLGMLDDAGYLSIVGRKKDVIIRGGQNIIPIEIENMLLTHPSVADVAVVGMPDPVMGERVCAYVVLEQGQALTFAEMIAHLEQRRAAKYKLPERLEIIEALPVSSGGKVAKARLREDIAYKLQVEAADRSYLKT